MTSSEAVHEALRAAVDGIMDQAFTWSGHLYIHPDSGSISVPEIKDTTSNRAQMRVHRDRALPEAVPWIFVNIRTAAPDLDDETVGAGVYFWTLRAQLWAAFSHPSEAIRRAMLTALVDKIEASLQADRTIGGAVDGAWLRPSEEIEETDDVGFPETLFVLTPFTLYYQSNRSSG